MSEKRKLIDGSEVSSLDYPIALIIYTKCPDKWKIIDMENGNQYMGCNKFHNKFSNMLRKKIKNVDIGSWIKII